MNTLNETEMNLVSGGLLDEDHKRFIDVMILLMKMKGTKMEEAYQIPGLPDEQREYIRSRWYKI